MHHAGINLITHIAQVSRFRYLKYVNEKQAATLVTNGALDVLNSEGGVGSDGYNSVPIVLAAWGDALWRHGQAYLQHQVQANAVLGCPHTEHARAEYEVPTHFAHLHTQVGCNALVLKFVQEWAA